MREPARKLPHIRSHQWLDAGNFEECLSVARKLRRQPGLMRIARANPLRWRKHGVIHREWEKILENNSTERVLETVAQDNDEGQRLRQGDPVVGILRERQPRRFLRLDQAFQK